MKLITKFIMGALVVANVGVISSVIANADENTTDVPNVAHDEQNLTSKIITNNGKHYLQVTAHVDTMNVHAYAKLGNGQTFNFKHPYLNKGETIEFELPIEQKAIKQVKTLPKTDIVRSSFVFEDMIDNISIKVKITYDMETPKMLKENKVVIDTNVTDKTKDNKAKENIDAYQPKTDGIPLPPKIEDLEPKVEQPNKVDTYSPKDVIKPENINKNEPKAEEKAETPAQPKAEEKAETPAQPKAEEKDETPAKPKVEEKDEAPAEPKAEEKDEAPAEPKVEEKDEAPAEPKAEEKAETPAEPKTEEKVETPAQPTVGFRSATTEPTINGELVNDAAKIVFDQLNAHREANGLAPLVWNPLRDAGTTVRATEFIVLFDEGKTGMDLHKRLDGTMYYTAFNTAPGAENVAWSGHIDGLMGFWKNSPSHNAAMLNPAFHTANVKVIKKGGYYYGVQIFDK